MRSLFEKIRRMLGSPENLPGSVFWKGGFYGLLFLCLLVMTMTGTFYRTGIPVWIMALVTMLAGIISFWIFRILGSLLHLAFMRIPTYIFAIIFAAVCTLILSRFVGFGLPSVIFYPGALAFMISFIIIFGSVSSLLKAKVAHKNLHITGIIIAVIVIGMCIYFLAYAGSDPYKLANNQIKTQLLSEKGVADPSMPGPHAIEYFTYGSGDDIRREEYGKEVKYVSSKVDASRLLPEWKGSKAKWRERYWEFGVKEFPLNGRVWMPQDKLNCPVAMIVHGNHGMEHYSDPGYAYLGELLASRGFIVVSVDENFINATWSGDFRGREMPARAWLLLKHLEQWSTWTTNEKHELFQKADLDNIILMGHSRGGEAAPIAAHFNKLPYFPDDANEKFNFNFGIKGIVSIAPTDKRYERRILLKDVNYLSIQGSYDSDEASFFGYRQFQRVTFDDSSFHFKSGLYVHGANHGQFNTVWGKYDSGAPFKWLLNTAPQISMEEQLQIAKVYISAFAEIVFNSNQNYVNLFINSNRGADWLPSVALLNTYEDSRTKKLITFEEDIDVTTGSIEGSVVKSNDLKIWREETLKFRDKDSQFNNAVVLGWRKDSIMKSPSYAIEFKEAIGMDDSYSLLINLAAGDIKQLSDSDKKDNDQAKADDPELEFQIELIDSAGNTAVVGSNKYKLLSPRLKVQLVKLASMHHENYGENWEPGFETFEFPLDAFTYAKDSLLNVQKITFHFNQNPSGVLIMDDIGLRSR